MPAAKTAKKRGRRTVDRMDLDLSTSPVYLEYSALERHYACSWARQTYARLFGMNTKIPVNQRNWEIMAGLERRGSPLNRWWVINNFNQNRMWPRRINPSGFDDVPAWSEVERALKINYPNWYAAQQATARKRTK